MGRSYLSDSGNIPCGCVGWTEDELTLDFGKSYAKPSSAHSDLQDDVMAYWRAKPPGWIPVKELDLGSRSMDREVKRADVFAMSETYPPRFVICEVKVSKPDSRSLRYGALMPNAFAMSRKLMPLPSRLLRSASPISRSSAYSPLPPQVGQDDFGIDNSSNRLIPSPRSP